MNTNSFRIVIKLFCALFVWLGLVTHSHALTFSFTAEQLRSFLISYRDSNDPNRQLLWRDIEAKLTEQGILFTSSGLRLTKTATGQSQPACHAIYAFPNHVGPETISYNMPWTMDLTPATGAAFQYSSGNLIFDFTLDGHLAASAVGSITWAPAVDYFGDCFILPQYGSENYSATINGPVHVALHMELKVSLEPPTAIDPVTEQPYGVYTVVITKVPPPPPPSSFQKLPSIRPPISLSGSIDPNIQINTSVSPFGDIFKALDDVVHGDINALINNSGLKPEMESRQQDLEKQLPIKYPLPQSLDPEVLSLLDQASKVPFLHDYIEQHGQELLFYMLIGDKQALLNSFASSAACNAAGNFRAGINPPALYTSASGSCVAANPEGANSGAYFSDSSCTASIDFQPTSLSSWCTEVIGANFSALLGNAASWVPDANPAIPGIPSQKWTISQGTQMPITSEPITGNTTPFMKKVNYRDTTREVLYPSGLKAISEKCKLEMRVYKKDVNATNLMPLMAIHGGSWQYRGAGFVGLEAQISHYTDEGFVVFAPFYRLAGHSDGNAECQGAAWNELTDDVEAALDWVKTNGSLFGAAPGKINLMGQSAGAHLAGWLVTHRPADVEKAILLYPPADVRDFLTHIDGAYAAYASPSLDILAAYYGETVDNLRRALANNSPYVAPNSFRDIVAGSTVALPPVFLIHGRSDTIIPSNQSVILCNAYGGNAVDNGGGSALRATYSCGTNGRLHLFEEALHGLDACITTRVNGMCRAGSESSRSLVAASLRQARGWLKGDEFGWLTPIINFVLEE